MTDVSGVSSVVARIEDPNNPGQFMNDEYSFGGIMYDDGSHNDGGDKDGIYGVLIDVSDNTSVNPSAHWDVNSTYKIDILAVDILGNRNNYACINDLNCLVDQGQTCDISSQRCLDLSGNKIYDHMANFSITKSCGSSVTDTASGAVICVSPAAAGNSGSSTNPSISITSFTSNLSTVVVGGSVILTAHVSGASNADTITFADNTDNINIGTVSISSGTASINYALTAGATISNHILRAYYNGSLMPLMKPFYTSLSLSVTSPGTCVTANDAKVCINPNPVISLTPHQ